MYPNRKHYASAFVSDYVSSKNIRFNNNLAMENRIRELRKLRGISMDALGDAIGTTRATIMKLEKGDMNLTADYMQKIADALEVDWVELLRPVSKIEKMAREIELEFSEAKKKEFEHYMEFLKTKID